MKRSEPKILIVKKALIMHEPQFTTRQRCSAMQSNPQWGYLSENPQAVFLPFL